MVITDDPKLMKFGEKLFLQCRKKFTKINFINEPVKDFSQKIYFPWILYFCIIHGNYIFIELEAYFSITSTVFLGKAEDVKNKHF